jgi:hypothetical protein
MCQITKVLLYKIYWRNKILLNMNVQHNLKFDNMNETIFHINANNRMC